MDLTRFSLYTALAIVTYLMLLAWQEDYPPTVASDDIVSESVNVATIPDTPSLTEVPPSSAVDVPEEIPNSLQTARETTQSESTSSIANDPSPRLIQVQTDTLKLSIDPVGGDVVYLALPLFLRELDNPDEPFVLLTNNGQRAYVAQSGLIGRDGIDAPNRAIYRSSSDSFSIADGEDSLTVDLSTVSGQVSITKRFHFTRGSYLFDVEYLIDNQSSQEWRGNVFGQIKRGDFDDPSDAGGFGASSYLGFVTTSPDDPYIELDFNDVDNGTTPNEMSGGWIGFSQHYFITAWVPAADSLNRFSTRRNNQNQYFGVFTSEALSVQPGSTGSQRFSFYAGPKDQYVLADIAPNLDLTIDYSFLWFLAAPIYWLLRQIDTLVGNYGVAIVLLTVLVKALFYKLSETQYRSMAGMRRMMPKMQQLKERYGEDRMRLQKETMALYQKEKINPFGGCLPMLVQMPVFIALYWVLMESVELRHAPFMLWLDDLSVRDPFFVLPLLMGGTMYLQTKLSPAPPDPMQAKVMTFMPVAMTLIFLWFPAGLVLYWLTNGLLGIAQQWYITRKIELEFEARKAT